MDAREIERVARFDGNRGSDQTMSGIVEMEVNGSVALITLRVPPINALDESALQELLEAAQRVEGDERVRGIVFASGVKGVFCTGGDLKHWPRRYPEDARSVSAAGRRVFDRIEKLTKPTVAAIQGRVIGDGLSLALACDIRLASPEAAFRLPELEYGFIPGWGTVGRLLDAVGRPATAEMLLLGEEIDAGRALAMGLVNQLVDAEDLSSFAMSLAGRMAAKPPKAMRYAKEALRRAGDAGFEHDLESEASCFHAVWGGEEWREGIARLFGAKSRNG